MATTVINRATYFNIGGGATQLLFLVFELWR